jgi:hypothetical protein
MRGYTQMITNTKKVTDWTPRTELGKKLLALRQEYIAAGGKLLIGLELDNEIQARRGGVERCQPSP